jgi:hypothetical protein
MALTKAEYEKALGFVPGTMSDEMHARLTSLDGSRAAAPADADMSRATPAGNANDSGPPMLAEAKKAAKGAKPVAPPTGTGTVSFMANTRQGEREIKENITSPADLDKYVAAGIITPEEAAAYKAQKWPAPKPPQTLVAGVSGKSTPTKKTSGAEMSAGDTAQASALKKADKEALAADPAGNLQAKFAGGTPMSVAGKGLAWNAPPSAGPVLSPFLPGAPAPTPAAASKYAYGMSNDPADPLMERFQTAVGDATTNAYEAMNPMPATPPAGLVALDKSLPKKKGTK